MSDVYPRDVLEAVAKRRGPTVRRLLAIVLEEADAELQRGLSVAQAAKSDSDEVLKR